MVASDCFFESTDYAHDKGGRNLKSDGKKNQRHNRQQRLVIASTDQTFGDGSKSVAGGTTTATGRFVQGRWYWS